MEFILRDGIQYVEHTFDLESTFEGVVFQQYKHIFGRHSLLFKKRKIQTETRIGTIPDAFVIDFATKKWFVVEVELATHDVYSHIVPQISKFKSALNNHETKQKLRKFFDDEINNDLYKQALFREVVGRNVDIHKYLSEVVEETTPDLSIIIDAHNPTLQDAVKNVLSPARVSVFKTFCRKGSTCLDDSIYHVESSITTTNKLPRSVIAPLPRPPVLAPNRISPPALSIPSAQPAIKASPVVSSWVALIPELRAIQTVTTWKEVCDYLGIDYKTDSARRVLRRWVKETKPDWPPVPEL